MTSLPANHRLSHLSCGSGQHRPPLQQQTAAARAAVSSAGGCQHTAEHRQRQRLLPWRKFASNNELTPTCWCSSCWIGAGLARNRASRNGSDEICRNMQENANICQNMHAKFAKISKICTTNMQVYVKICTTNMQIYLKIWTQNA